MNDSSFAFQAIAGFSKALNQQVDFFADYRYLTAQNILVDNLTTGLSLGDFEYNNNGIAFGLRLRR